MDENKKKIDGNKEPSQQRRICDIAKKPKELSILYGIIWRNWRHMFPFFSSPRMDRKKKKIVMAKEMSIICIVLSIDTKEKSDLVLGPNTYMSSKLEVIQALKAAFKWTSDHEEIDVQRVSGTSDPIEQGQQSSINVTEKIQRTQNLRNIQQLMEASNKISIELDKKKKEKNKMKSILRDRASAGTGAVQHSYDVPYCIIPAVPTVINFPTNTSNMLPELIEDDLMKLSLRNIEQLKIAYKTSIRQRECLQSEIRKKKALLSKLRASASAVRH